MSEYFRGIYQLIVKWLSERTPVKLTIVRRIWKLLDDGRLYCWKFIWEKNKNRSTVDATIVDTSAQESAAPVNLAVDDNYLKTTWPDKTNIMDDSCIVAKELELLKKSNQIMKQKMKFIQDSNTATIQILQTKHDWVVGQLDCDADEKTTTSKDRFNHDEWENENEMFVQKGLSMLRDNYNEMEKKVKTIDDAVLAQNVKLNMIIEKLQVHIKQISTSPANKNVIPEAVHEKINNRLEKLLKIVDSLKYEKLLLIKTIRKMATKIKNNKRKHTTNKKDLNKFMGQMKKNLADVKRHFYFLQRINNEKTKNISLRIYDSLKIRQSNIERAGVKNQIQTEQIRQNMMIMSSLYLKGGENNSLTNGRFDANVQQEHSPRPVIPIIPLPPSAPTNILQSSPKIIPPPPCQPPEPQAGQYLNYTINTDILKEMSSKLRKPDGDNIRKIPRRKDINIPNKVKNTNEEDVPLPPPAPPLPVINLEAPAVDPESPVAPLTPSEFPLTLVDTESP